MMSTLKVLRGNVQTWLGVSRIGILGLFAVVSKLGMEMERISSRTEHEVEGWNARFKIAQQSLASSSGFLRHAFH